MEKNKREPKWESGFSKFSRTKQQILGDHGRGNIYLSYFIMSLSYKFGTITINNLVLAILRRMVYY